MITSHIVSNRNGREEINEVELTVLIPMFNEAENIRNTVSMIKQVFNEFDKTWELLLVNDGSTDSTLQIAQEIEEEIDNLRVISYPVNSGRGKALRTGFEHAWGRYVVTIDCDLTYSPDHILRIYDELIDPEQMNDVVLGSAYMKGGQVVGVNPWRLFISKLGNKILAFTFPQPFKTSTCILRGYRKEVLQSLALDSEGKEIHLEILSKVCALGFRVKEIPATLSGRQRGKSKFKFRKTSVTHLVFSIFERPILLFGLAGLFLIFSGFLIGCYIVWLRYLGTLNPGRPLIPFMIILLIMGSQFFCFAFVASQNNHLRNQVYRLQKQIKRLQLKKDLE
ncbi:MAG: glycosyltransferase [Desulforhopalus sp.]|nr:glycosyltransferase [Desulforhopalus sp.]